MNSILKPLFLILIVVGLTSCGSNIKVKETWQSEDFDIIKDQKVLVINKFKKKGLRQRGEQQIANKLRDAGINAVEAFVAFPELENRDDRTPEQVAQIVDRIKAEGFQGVVITKVDSGDASRSTTTRLSEENKRETDPYFDTSQYGSRTVSFGVYYNNPAELVPNSTPGPDGAEETTTNFTEIYMLETLTYYLGPDRDQVLGSMKIEVTDPDNLMEIFEKYGESIAQQFK